MEPIVSQDGNSIDASNNESTISEVFGHPILDLHLTLWDLFQDAAHSSPDADAIVSLWQPHNHLSNDQHQAPSGTNEPYLKWSYSQLKDKAERLAESLEKLGCREGMRLAVVLGNCAEWGLFFWAAAKIRMAFVPLDATVPLDAKKTMLSVKPQVLVAQDADSAKALDLPEAQISRSSICILCTGSDLDSWLKLSDLLKPTERLDSTHTITDSADYNQDEDPALIIFTSGTTGDPKGCWHTNRNLISQCCDFDPEVNAMGPLRWLIHTPVSHVFAINNALRAWRWSGTAVFPSKSFNVDATLKALVQEQCSIMSATPTLVKALMAHPSFPRADQLDLRIVTIGGTSIGAEDIRLCREGLGAQMAIQVFGMSEGGTTGDQARIDEKGVVYILGRYKDLIIRGGENIYPINIERELQQLDGLQVQVIGVPDDLAGQVPVAIVVLPEDMTKAQVMEKARKADQRYALDSVYTLQELGLERFPLTALGKVKKQQLKARVLEHRQANSATKTQLSNGASTPPFVDKLLGICEQLTGTRPSVTESFKYLADSITLLRYCDHVLRICGQRLYLQDFVENDTIEKQAHLLLSRKLQQARLVITPEVPKYNPPSSKQQARTSTSSSEFTSTPAEEKDTFFFAKRAVVRAGFSPSDIEDVLPIRHSLHRTAIGSRPQSYHNRMVFRVCNVAQHQILRALQKALDSRPMLRTIVFPASNRVPFHAVLVTSSALVDQLVHEVEVDSEDDAWNIFRDDTSQAHSSPFMFQTDVVRTMSDGQLFLSFTFNHSVIDALSITQWYHELDHWIQDINTDIPALTPFRLFSDLFTQYEDSEPARRNIAFHTRKLRGISRFSGALWPLQKAPGLLIANDEGSPLAKERRQVRDKVWNGKWDARAHELQYPRSGRVLALSGLTKLQDEHNIHPSLFTKSAIVLFNVLQTGSSHALLNVWESARSWPFIPKWMEKLLPPAMSIDGPTVQWVLNMTEVARSETVLEFLQRMLAESEETKEHEHVPWNKVVQNLSDEGPAAVDASFRQSFVWDVSLAMSLVKGPQSNFTSLEPIARYDWPDCGFFWNAFMIDSINLYFIASWDTAQMNDKEVEGHCDALSDVMRKLCDERNWDKKLSDVFRL
ncbi:hypothetical protein ACKAV7_008937 [Fusarium commune]